VSWNVGEGPAHNFAHSRRQLPPVPRIIPWRNLALKAPLAETLIATLSYRLWTKVRPARSLPVAPLPWPRRGSLATLLPGKHLRQPRCSSASGSQATHASNAQLADPRIEAPRRSLLHQMTLEEKIGQLAQYNDTGDSPLRRQPTPNRLRTRPV